MSKPDPDTLSATAADSEAALRQLAPRLAAISHDAVREPRARVSAIGSVALAVVAEIDKPGVEARFASLGKDNFDTADLALFRLAARAMNAANAKLLAAAVQSTEAKVPADLAKRATERRARMLKCAKYHFEDDATLSKEIADIERGSGYEDLAADLLRLRTIYTEQKAVVQKDTKHYRAADARGAQQDADAITAELKLSRNAAENNSRDQVARLWTLLDGVYSGEVMPAARFVFRHERDVEERFPSLLGAARAAAARGGKGGDTGDGGGEEPAVGSSGGEATGAPAGAGAAAGKSAK